MQAINDYFSVHFVNKFGTNRGQLDSQMKKLLQYERSIFIPHEILSRESVISQIPRKLTYPENWCLHIAGISIDFHKYSNKIMPPQSLIRNPWIVKAICNNGACLKNAQRLQILKHISTERDESIVKKATDGEVSIEAVFTPKAVGDLLSQYDGSPPDWDRSYIIIKVFDFIFRGNEEEAKCGFVLQVDHFQIHNLHEGFANKFNSVDCMTIPVVREKVREIWLQKKEQNNEVDFQSVSLTQLLAEMGAQLPDSSTSKEDSDGVQNDTAVDVLDGRLLGKPVLQKITSVAEFVIMREDEIILDTMEEWIPGYNPVAAVVSTNVSSPQPTDQSLCIQPQNTLASGVDNFHPPNKEVLSSPVSPSILANAQSTQMSQVTQGDIQSMQMSQLNDGNVQSTHMPLHSNVQSTQISQSDNSQVIIRPDFPLSPVERNIDTQEQFIENMASSINPVNSDIDEEIRLHEMAEVSPLHRPNKSQRLEEEKEERRLQSMQSSSVKPGLNSRSLYSDTTSPDHSPETAVNKSKERYLLGMPSDGSGDHHSNVETAGFDIVNEEVSQDTATKESSCDSGKRKSKCGPDKVIFDNKRKPHNQTYTLQKTQNAQALYNKSQNVTLRKGKRKLYTLSEELLGSESHDNQPEQPNVVTNSDERQQLNVTNISPISEHVIHSTEADRNRKQVKQNAMLLEQPVNKKHDTDSQEMRCEDVIDTSIVSELPVVQSDTATVSQRAEVPPSNTQLSLPPYQVPLSGGSKTSSNNSRSFSHQDFLLDNKHVSEHQTKLLQLTFSKEAMDEMINYFRQTKFKQH